MSPFWAALCAALCAALLRPCVCACKVRDSGKTVVDAMIGEVLTTCEKFKWTIANGEK